MIIARVNGSAPSQRQWATMPIPTCRSISKVYWRSATDGLFIHGGRNSWNNNWVLTWLSHNDDDVWLPVLDLWEESVVVVWDWLRERVWDGKNHHWHLKKKRDFAQWESTEKGSRFWPPEYWKTSSISVRILVHSPPNYGDNHVSECVALTGFLIVIVHRLLNIRHLINEVLRFVLSVVERWAKRTATFWAAWELGTRVRRVNFI